jgi:CheY-like chemotaxis protein
MSTYYPNLPDSSRSAQAVGRPMEILMVEDGLTDACLAIGVLKKGDIHHRLTLVRDGVEALEFVHQEGRFARAPRPDLILLDLTLPKKDGREVLEEIKSGYDTKDIPVVILTGSAAQEDRLRCELLHVDAYMTKPVNMEKFLAVIRQLRSFWHADLILPALE